MASTPPGSTAASLWPYSVLLIGDSLTLALPVGSLMLALLVGSLTLALLVGSLTLNGCPVFVVDVREWEKVEPEWSRVR